MHMLASNVKNQVTKYRPAADDFDSLPFSQVSKCGISKIAWPNEWDITRRTAPSNSFALSITSANRTFQNIPIPIPPQLFPPRPTTFIHLQSFTPLLLPLNSIQSFCCSYKIAISPSPSPSPSPRPPCLSHNITSPEESPKPS